MMLGGHRRPCYANPAPPNGRTKALEDGPPPVSPASPNLASRTKNRRVEVFSRLPQNKHPKRLPQLAVGNSMGHDAS